MGRKSGVDVVQVSVLGEKVGIFHISNMSRVPAQLKTLLERDGLIFVGVQVRGDMTRLQAHGLEFRTKHRDLRTLCRQKGVALPNGT